MSRAEARGVDARQRRALAWGAAILILGLAIVGTGRPAEGGPIALAGLLLTIYGIHRFGRLGPDDIEPESPAQAAATDATFGGLAALIAGGSFVAGSTSSTAAYLVMGAGAIALGWGQRERGRVAENAAKENRAAEKPEAEERDPDDAPPKPRRRSAKRKRPAE